MSRRSATTRASGTPRPSPVVPSTATTAMTGRCSARHLSSSASSTVASMQRSDTGLYMRALVVGTGAETATDIIPSELDHGESGGSTPADARHRGLPMQPGY